MTDGNNSRVRRFFASVTALQVAGVMIGALTILAIGWIIFSGGSGDDQTSIFLSSTG